MTSSLLVLPSQIFFPQWHFSRLARLIVPQLTRLSQSRQMAYPSASRIGSAVWIILSMFAFIPGICDTYYRLLNSAHVFNQIVCWWREYEFVASTDDARKKNCPNMEGPLRICFFFSLAIWFYGVIPLSIASVDANNISNVLNFAFRGPVPETSFFFSQPVAGLTNRVPVQDSRAGAPLTCNLVEPEHDSAGVTISGESCRANQPFTVSPPPWLKVKPSLKPSNRVFQRPQTRPQLMPQLEPQLNPNLTRVGVWVGVQCLNAIYSSLFLTSTHTSTSPAELAYIYI